LEETASVPKFFFQNTLFIKNSNKFIKNRKKKLQKIREHSTLQTTLLQTVGGREYSALQTTLLTVHTADNTIHYYTDHWRKRAQ